MYSKSLSHSRPPSAIPLNGLQGRDYDPHDVASGVETGYETLCQRVDRIPIGSNVTDVANAQLATRQLTGGTRDYQANALLAI